MAVIDVSLRGRFHSGCHRTDLELLIDFCDSHPDFQFLQASELEIPTRSNTEGDYIQSGRLHHVVLRSILADQSNWHQVFSVAQSSSLNHEDSLVFSFGPERCVPASLARKLGSRLIQSTALNMTHSQLSLDLVNSQNGMKNGTEPSLNAIAVVGMSCQLPGAADLEEFWQLLHAGESQHVEVPSHRFGFETAWRENDPKRKWYGNFLQDHDVFDHKFFKKSPREMESTDPQHRLILQAAYQAVEQSGYFGVPDQDKVIGCYIGVGLVDYENNIAGYPANAYSATGNLKSFAAGKISHYFGWTGPGLTVDTACSSSAVAIHLACKAILGGECSAALAGGVNIMTSPLWFQNLAGATFLSPTGQCKPFDAKADGYCRGEAVGAVFLKKLSSAISDGDQILGVIAGSAVFQNQNCTPITVPNATSLADLFGHAVRQSGLKPQEVSVVEAHGTGTPVGDPAEYDSIRRVFGGVIRSNTLSLGSVKGLVGHSESASGIVALIKTLLMIHEGMIPPQPSFKQINPSIEAKPSDKIEIATSAKPWEVGFRAALINNYGASGSNATLVVTEAPYLGHKAIRDTSVESLHTKYPFYFCGFDESSLRRYVGRFIRFLKSKSNGSKNLSIANLAFQVSRQSNRKLSHALIFSCGSIDELTERLTEFQNGSKSLTATKQRPVRPVILCFGGQISTFVGLSRQVYENVETLRSHVNKCDTICISLGLESLYPSIFQTCPIGDIVTFQTVLFAFQYSCARSWIDCGVEVAAVVGHSFGEITALCVSGTLSLEDAFKVVSGRAALIRDSWGPDGGSMMAVEADLEDVERLLDSSNKACQGEPLATIACYNGPRSFTLAGPATVIATAERLASDPAFSSVRSKKLNVTNAFHSTLVEPLVPELKHLGKGFAFKEPLIPLETATEFESKQQPTSQFLADHMRNPVYFNHAIQRLLQRYPSAIWLEAGSNSTVTVMAGRALGSPSSSHFQSINITNNGGLQPLAEATMQLWKEGLSVSFWPHHTSQTSQYNPLLLPPYQFEKAKHWMELKKPQKLVAEPLAPPQAMELPKGLWTFVGYQDKERRSVRFRVNTMSKRFTDYVSGHIIVETAPLCPSTLQLDIAIDALMNLRQSTTGPSLHPQLQGMDSLAPMSMDPTRFVWLDAESSDDDSLVWDWKMTSNAQNTTASIVHVRGRIVLEPTNDPKLKGEFAKYERLVDRQRCLRLLDSADVDEIIQGRHIYKTFAEIVEYADVYRGVQKIVGKGNESAGRIVKAYNGETWLDTGLADSFCQVAGIFVNNMTDRSDGEMYISDRIDQWIRSPKLTTDSSRPEIWEAYACHHRSSEKEYVSDVFVFDPRNSALLEVILGIHYKKVLKAGMRKVLSTFIDHTKTLEPAAPSQPIHAELSNGTGHMAPMTPVKSAKPRAPKKVKKQSSAPNIAGDVRDLLCKLSGLEPEEISDKSDLVDIGIDSLMGMELAREIEIAFKCTLESSDLIELTDFQSLVKLVQKTLGLLGGDAGAEEEEDGVDEDEEEVDEEETRSTSQPNGVHEVPKTNSDVPRVNGVSSLTNSTTSSIPDEATLHSADIIDAFELSKQSTDQFIADNKLGNYVRDFMPRSTELCLVYIIDAFEKLGCSFRSAKPGQTLDRIQHLPRHKQFVECIYDILENHGRLIDIEDSKIRRTAVSIPTKSAEVLLHDIIWNFPEHAADAQLTHLTGSKLAECLTGEADGLQILFGTPEGREIAAAMYGKSPINLAWIKQIEDFLRRLLSKHTEQKGPIRILEMGAGTGGTTSKMVPLLASLGISIKYTVTEISSSLVASARKRFKGYPFMEYRVLDIEKSPSAELLHSQHIVLATNCVHATHSLVKSTKNIHDLLRPDGFLLMLEMTETLPWIDLIFGLVEGWWLFEDGRRHALASPPVWDKSLQEAGYRHFDWTEGNCPEANIQRVMIALASSPRYDRTVIPPKPLQMETTDLVARQAAIDKYIHKYSQAFSVPLSSDHADDIDSSDQCIVVTGATGSLGSHLVAHFAELSTVKTVVCLNRLGSTEATLRQHQALKTRSIVLGSDALLKLKVLETDTSKPLLGLPPNEYQYLLDNVTHIVHNAWPMSITRPVNAFEPQFKTMHNLIELASQISHDRSQGPRIGFQFISSIGTVGLFPVWSGQTLVPEERMIVKSVLPNGYGDAKLVCEHILEETLQQYPCHFRAMSVRIGQIAGSTTTGYWNSVEHFAFMVKSAQTLKALPDLQGVRPPVSQVSILFHAYMKSSLPFSAKLTTSPYPPQDLSWCPVNTTAATLSDLLLTPTTPSPSPIYHIENPTRQPWRAMLLVLADALAIPPSNIIPFDAWIARVRAFPGCVERDNPAGRLVAFLESHFERMSCGGLVLGTERSRADSETLRGVREVGEGEVRAFVRGWREGGFLS